MNQWKLDTERPFRELFQTNHSEGLDSWIPEMELHVEKQRDRNKLRMFARQDQWNLANCFIQSQIKEILTQEQLEVLNLKNWKHSGTINRNKEYMKKSFEKEDYFCFCHILGRQWYSKKGCSGGNWKAVYKVRERLWLKVQFVPSSKEDI